MLKKIIVLILFVIAFPTFFYGTNLDKPKEFTGLKIYKFPFYVFSFREHISYFALSGYMGDVNNIKVTKERDPYSFKVSLKITYIPKFDAHSQGWGGLYWQYPPNNWGDDEKGGYDLSSAKFLYFYAKGAKGDELVEFKIGGIKGPYGDTDTASTGIIPLTRKWKLYKIDLRKKDLKNIIGGFCVIFMAQLNPEGLTFYLNDIYYSDKIKPERRFFIDYSNPGKKKKEKELSK